MGMFCYQCEQTAKGTGCTVKGVCGKEEPAARIMDVLVYMAEGISQYAHRAAQLGERDEAVDVFVLEALFSTVTNVDFDADRLEGMVHKAVTMRDKAKTLYEAACARDGKTAETPAGPAVFMPADNRDGLIQQAEAIGIEARKRAFGDDVAGVQDLILFGVKGAAAYLDHAQILGKNDPAVYAQVHEILAFLAENPSDLDALLGKALETGELNLKAMELLDAGNTERFGHPEPTQVRITPVKGKCIVVSGHDLLDLEELLKQTAGKGINVYTHGEMLPCHAYPELKKYPHLAGNFGNAWQDQAKEFAAFPGAILMTTNCIQKPREEYSGRIFTTGLVGWPGETHISDQDYTPVIEAALAAPGYAEDGEERYITVGFGRNTVMGVAGKVIDLVKEGKIRHFFLVGGCDGAKSGRNYYTEFVEKTPDDTVVLTLACGKYRFNKKDLGAIDGIPRLLDIGQCNDAYSAIQIAVALAQAFECGVNDLPLSLVLSWYEQKAVAILLTLLHLGVRDIRLGPSLPAFVTPAVLQVLVDKFAIKPIATAEEDLQAILG